MGAAAQRFLVQWPAYADAAIVSIKLRTAQRQREHETAMEMLAEYRAQKAQAHRESERAILEWRACILSPPRKVNYRAKLAPVRPRPCIGNAGPCPDRALTTHPRGRCPRCRSQRQRNRGESAREYTRARWKRLRLQVLDRDGYRCHWCGGYATVADHLLPKALGGPDDLGNLVAACWRCNSARTPRIRTPK